MPLSPQQPPTALAEAARALVEEWRLTHSPVTYGNIGERIKELAAALPQPPPSPYRALAQGLIRLRPDNSEIIFDFGDGSVVHGLKVDGAGEYVRLFQDGLAAAFERVAGEAEAKAFFAVHSYFDENNLIKGKLYEYTASRLAAARAKLAGKEAA